MRSESGVFRSLRLALGLGLALSVAGCESMDFLSFLEPQKKPAPGERRQVFPNGVPGVDYSAPVGQPSNPAAIEPAPPPPAGNPQQR